MHVLCRCTEALELTVCCSTHNNLHFFFSFYIRVYLEWGKSVSGTSLDSRNETFRSDNACLDWLHRLPYPQRARCKGFVLMFKCLIDLAPAYLSGICNKTSAVSGCSLLRPTFRRDLVVLSYRTERNGVQELLQLLFSVVWMCCLLNWGICQLVLGLLQNTGRRNCSVGFSDGACTFEFD